MVVKVISELKNASKLKIFPETGPRGILIFRIKTTLTLIMAGLYSGYSCITISRLKSGTNLSKITVTEPYNLYLVGSTTTHSLLFLTIVKTC